MVEHALVIERRQEAPDIELAESLVVDDRQLERGTLEMVHEDERVVRIHARVLGRRAEEVLGVGDHELVQRRARRDEDRGRPAAPPTGAPGLLPE